MDTRVGALAGGIKPRDSGSRVEIHIYAAHEIVLAGEHRNRLLCHIISAFKTCCGYRGKVLTDKISALVYYIKIKFVAARAFRLGDYRLGNNVAGS